MTTKNRLDTKDFLLCLILTAFCSLLFRDIIIDGYRLIGDDFIGFYLGMKKFLYDELWIHHSIPFWNPYLLGGIPYWAHFESTIFYPLGFLFWLIPPEVAYGYTMFLHLVLAATFMYILARSLGIGRAGSFVAGAVFTCNGFIMATLYLGHMCPAQSYIWLPMVIYFLNLAVTAKTCFYRSFIAGIIWGIQILAGAPQDAFYTFLAAMLFLGCSSKFGRKEPVGIPRLFAIAFFFFLAGTGIASVQIIPAFEFIGESVRASLHTYEVVTQASYPPEGIITTILPNFFGNYAKGGFWVENVPWSLPYQNLYVGILPLMSLCFISYRNSDQKHIIIFAGILAVIALLLALGRNTPIYKLAYLLPGFDKFRTPSRVISLWVFAIGLLGGKGFDALIHVVRHQPTKTKRLIFLTSLGIALLLLDLILHYHRPLVLRVFSPFVVHDAIPIRMSYATDIILGEFHRFTWITLCSLLCLLLMKRGFIRPAFSAVSLCIILLMDLGLANSSGIRRDVAFHPWIEKINKGLDSSIGRDKSIYRVGSYLFGLGPNLEMLLGYQTVGGFTALIPTRYYEYINHYANGELPEGWQSFHYGASKNSVLMDLLNVKYAISHTAGTYEERKSHLPRAFMVYRYELIEKEQVLKYLTSPDFDPTKKIFFEKEQDPPQLFQDAFRSSLPIGQVKILSYRPDHITIQTESSEAGFLFLSEVFYPGWKAFIDGQPTRILRGNYLFRVLEVPEGHHEVRLEFDPWTIKAGTGITLLTAFLILAIPVFRRLKRKAPRS
ncbi:MAG: YfhO family protein [Desulfobacterales bacterium]|nr:YfhO family protein [Desulfobacterales bacterium]